MSSRAACRLEQLGVTAYDFAGGKMEWLAHGLPYEGTADLVSRHIDDAPRSDVVTATGGVVIALRQENGETKFGPTTVRPSEERDELEKRMAKRDVDRILVTDPSGRFLGTYRRGRESDRGTPE